MARSPYERKAQKELEKDGYKVDWKTRPFRVPKGYQVDYFGLFDLVAFLEGKPLRWISIKGKAGIPSAHRQAVRRFRLDPSANTKEIWAWRKKGGWNKQIIKNDGKENGKLSKVHRE